MKWEVLPIASFISYILITLFYLLEEGMHAMACMWRWEDKLWESILSLQHRSPRDLNQIHRLGLAESAFICLNTRNLPSRDMEQYLAKAACLFLSAGPEWRKLEGSEGSLASSSIVFFCACVGRPSWTSNSPEDLFPCILLISWAHSAPLQKSDRLGLEGKFSPESEKLPRSLNCSCASGSWHFSFKQRVACMGREAMVDCRILGEGRKRSKWEHCPGKQWVKCPLLPGN